MNPVLRYALLLTIELRDDDEIDAKPNIIDVTLVDVRAKAKRKTRDIAVSGRFPQVGSHQAGKLLRRDEMKRSLGLGSAAVCPAT